MSAVYTPILRMDTEIHFDDMLYSQINTSFFFSNTDQDTNYASLMWQSENFFATRVQYTCTITITCTTSITLHVSISKIQPTIIKWLEIKIGYLTKK